MRVNLPGTMPSRNDSKAAPEPSIQWVACCETLLGTGTLRDNDFYNERTDERMLMNHR